MRLVIRYECDPAEGRTEGAACEWVLTGADLDPPNWSRLVHVFGELYVTMQLGCVGDEIMGHDEGCHCSFCSGGAA